MYHLGIDIGTSSVKLAALDDREVVFTAYARHGGSPRARLARLLDDLDGRPKPPPSSKWGVRPLIT